jgi:hypothetical protein
VFDEHGQSQTGTPQGGDDLAKTVVPLPRFGLGEHGIGVHIRLGGVESHWIRVLEVRVAERDRIGALLVDGPQHGVALAQEKPAAGPQQCRHHLGPARDIGQPHQRPDAGVHQIESPWVENACGPVDIGLDVVDGESGAGSNPLSDGNRRGGEVQPRHSCPEPSQRQCVRSDVTLQVDTTYAGDIAQPGQVEADHIRQRRSVADQRVHRVVG